MSGPPLKTKFLFISLGLLLLAGRLALAPRLNLKEGQLVKVTGRLKEEPQVISGRQSFRLGQFLVTTDRYPRYHFRDELTISGKVKTAARWSVVETYRLSYPDIEAVEDKESVSVKGWAIGLGEKIIKVYQQALPSPYDGLLAGIVLGNKSLIPAELWEKLRFTGTLHIMVASGMNVALLGGVVLSLLTFLVKRRTAILIAIVVIYIYGIMTGLTPPITRAVIMVGLIYLSQFLGREGAGERVLWLTGMIMVLISPELIFDISFQLSFLATSGLVYLQPRFQASKYRLLRLPDFSSTLAAQVFTLPVLLGSFGQFNLISPVINLAILWTVPLILMLGIGAGVLGMVWSVLGKAASYLAFPLLYYLKHLVDLFAKMEDFQLKFSGVPWGWWVGYYLILFVLLRYKKHD